MKSKLLNILKVVGVAAGGALVVDPNVQTAVQSVLPPPYNLLAGTAFGVAALFIKSPAQKAEPTSAEKK